MRGSDCKITPYFVAYLCLHYKFGDSISWTGNLYIHKEKVPEKVEEYLKNLNISLKPYEDITQDCCKFDCKTYVDLTNCNAALSNLIPEANIVSNESTPPKNVAIIERLKGVKNAREIQGFTECHIRDGTAIVPSILSIILLYRSDILLGLTIN